MPLPPIDRPPFQTKRLVQRADGQSYGFLNQPAVRPVTVSERRWSMPPERMKDGQGGDFDLTIANCDGGDPVVLEFRSGRLMNAGAAIILSGCGGGGGSGSA